MNIDDLISNKIKIYIKHPALFTNVARYDVETFDEFSDVIEKHVEDYFISVELKAASKRFKFKIYLDSSNNEIAFHNDGQAEIVCFSNFKDLRDSILNLLLGSD